MNTKTFPKRQRGGNPALLTAAKNGDLLKLNELIEAGADLNVVDINNYTPLNTAVYHNKIEIVKRLIQAGADINKPMANGSTPLYTAAANGSLPIAEHLIEAGANINKANVNGTTPLFIAAQTGYLSIVSRLIEEGADINKANVNGTTPLFIAAQTGYLSVVSRLIEAGADINKANVYGTTPLAIAISRNNMPVVHHLIDKGANVNTIDTNGFTPLYIAIYYNIIEMVKPLIEAGADINYQNVIGATPLFTAAQKGHLQIVKILLDAGADKTIPDNVGNIPVDVAKTSEIKDLLLADDTKWKGWTRSDVEKFDTLFTDEGAMNYSCCPVCLKYVLRQDGCLYMHHNCTALPGFYHKKLYMKYKGNHGEVEWCTSCGRICKEHRHYKLNLASDSVPGFEIPTPVNIDVFFQNDCRGANGGGGLPEKIERVRALRQFARELQEVVGEISQTKALEELTEAMWNAPVASVYSRRSQKILATKKWNFETANAFPSNSLNGLANLANNETVYANIQRSAANRNLLPTLDQGFNVIGMNDNVPVVYFQHRLPDGSVEYHEEEGIGLPSLVEFIQDVNRKFGTEEFGECPFQCGARLHPDEVAKAFELLGAADNYAALIADYRAKFNRKFRAVN